MKTLSVLHLATVLLTFGSRAVLRAQVTTFVSPVANAYDEFGYAVAAVGTNRVLIGDPEADTGTTNAGAAYLFDLAGNLITTYTNPEPAVDDNFGNAVAAVGDHRVLIAARSDDESGYNAGVAYLFDLAGTLITTYHNPSPGAGTYFGYFVAGVGTNRVLIGANVNAAFLFDLQGNLVATCYNPSPQQYSGFGNTVAAAGTNRLLVTAYNDSTILTGMGLAYLFDMAGNRVITYTNPTPDVGDSFGWSATGVGTDRVLLGAPRDDTGAQDAGAAYLFDLAGHLITTYTNPAPFAGDWFGNSVAAVGTDRVLIGARYGSLGAAATGVAYLFSTNGTLLTTLTNPTPAAGDWFGYSVAAVDKNSVLIGAPQDSTAAQYAGAAYLVALAPGTAPSLTVRLTAGHTVVVSWSSPSTGWELQQSTNNVGSLNWSSVTSGIQDDGTTKTFTVNPRTGIGFYRLHKL